MEETKVCCKCGIEKLLCNFSIRKNRNKHICKTCKSIYNRIYNETHREEVKQQRKIYYEKNNISIKHKAKIYREINKDKNRDKNLKRGKIYYQENKEAIRKRSKEYRNKNKDKIKKQNNTPQRRVSTYLRSRVNDAIKSQYGNKAYKTMKLIGCSVDDCIRWLENQFLPGMSWKNHGEWHIDHIIPCASFDLTKPEEQLKCFHYTNLRPLWATDNLSKNDRIEVFTSQGVFLV